MRIIASRFKYILTTDRVNRLHHGRHCADSSRVFWATQRYLEDSATRLVFHPQPTLRDLGTQYLRLKWFRELVSRGVLDEPAAQGQLPFYRSNWLPLLLYAVGWGFSRRRPKLRLETGMMSRRSRRMNRRMKWRSRRVNRRSRRVKWRQNISQPFHLLLSYHRLPRPPSQGLLPVPAGHHGARWADGWTAASVLGRRAR